MIKKDWIVISTETKLAYAQRDTFVEACEVAMGKRNGQVITREDYEKLKKERSEK